MENNKKLRILHAPIVALYQPYLYTKGLRELGHKADYMAFNFKPESWLAGDCDFDLELDGTIGLQIEKTREIEFFLYAIENYDVFRFHSGCGLLNPAYSLWNRLDELSFLKKRGKKIVMSWWGCDLRTEEVDIVYKYSACLECEKSVREHCKASTEKREVIEKSFKYVDVHLTNGDLVASFDKVKWQDNAINCDEYRTLGYDDIPETFRLPESDKIRIYHSFGNSETRGDVKGTKYIKKAVEKLQSYGYQVEFIFLDKVPNRDIKYYQAQADIVVDQLRSGWHGSTAIECLSMGKPVITYIRPEVEEILPPRDHPLINATIDNIYEVLKDLLDNPEKIKDIGKQSRKYALQYHHYINVTKQLESIYMELIYD